MNDVAELFLKDPLEMTNEDIDKIIAEMRSRRVAFKSAPTIKGKATPKLTPKQEEAKKLIGDIDLGI